MTAKGVSRLSIIPVRKQAQHRSEMVTQLLFGEHYEVLEISKDKEWVKIRQHFDGYEGWISALQHYPISEEYYEQINFSDYKITTDLVANILFKKKQIPIVLGSIIPISSNELFQSEEQVAFSGESKSLSTRRDFEYFKGILMKYLHAPYLWGGKSPLGIDCSGFVQMAFKLNGYRLKRDASQQVMQGEEVNGLAEALPGDLAFFRNEERVVTHVGVLLEGQEIIHASGQVRVDIIDVNGIFNAEQNRYTHYLTDIRRILK